MRDGPLRRSVKRVALWNFMLSVERALQRRRGRIPFVLGGECRRCARCCEAPGLQVGRLVWYVPTLRRIFLWWQREVNGWELVGRDIRSRVFVFKCSHFDWATRSCDSYDSRPGVCRDYPRALLSQEAPEFLPGCGYRPVAVNSRKLIRALEEARVTPAQMDRLKEGLHLEKEE